MTQNFFEDKLRKFLPPFLPESEVREALIKTLGKKLYEFWLAVEDLQNADWSGRGLELTADENKIFYNKVRMCLVTPGGDFLLMPDGETQLAIRMEDLGADELLALTLPDGETSLLLTDETYLTISQTLSFQNPVRERLTARFDYWRKRGTPEGILNDLQNIYGLDESIIKLKSFAETGIVTETTTFDDDNFIGVDSIVEFWPTDRGYISRNEERDLLIRKYILPYDSEIVYKGE